MMKNICFPERVKRILPVFIIFLYWSWCFFKFFRLEVRTPKTLNEILFYSTLEAVVALGVVVILLKFSFQESFSKYYLFDSYKTPIKKGLIWGVVSFILINFIFSPIGQVLSQVFKISEINFPKSDISFLFKGVAAPFYWILISIIGGGLAEEIVRFFSLSFFEKTLGKKGLVVSILISTIIFGIGHIYQGSSWAIAHFFSGLLWSYVYWKERNLIVNICAHAIFDILGSLIACLIL